MERKTDNGGHNFSDARISARVRAEPDEATIEAVAMAIIEAVVGAITKFVDDPERMLAWYNGEARAAIAAYRKRVMEE